LRPSDWVQECAVAYGIAIASLAVMRGLIYTFSLPQDR
jgi:hypothetical protein